jgi:hypothetical protein
VNHITYTGNYVTRYGLKWAYFAQKTNCMKKLRNVVSILFLSMFLWGMFSCEVTSHVENGRHRGWFHKHETHRENRPAVLIIDTKNHNHHERNERHGHK